MQTFLPYPSFRDSLECLDIKRLGNQVYREGLTLLRGGWHNHPAAKMWKGYESALALYCWVGLDVLRDLYDREYIHHYVELSKYLPMIEDSNEVNQADIKLPNWIGNEDFHASHRSNLLRKNLEYYQKFNWTEPDNLPYIWPV